MVKRIHAASLLIGALLWMLAGAAAAEFTEGEHYIRLESPLPTLQKDKIESKTLFETSKVRIKRTTFAVIICGSVA